MDDHDLLRLGLKTLVQSGSPSAALAVTVLEARSLQTAIDGYREHGPSIGVVLLDLELPDARGLAGLPAFLATFSASGNSRCSKAYSRVIRTGRSRMPRT